MSGLRALIFLFFLFPVNLKAEEIDPLLSKINSLKEHSFDVAPDLTIFRAAKKQKSAETYTRFTDFLPKANFFLRKEKDFYEERNVQLQALGIGVYNSSWGIDYSWALFNYGSIQNNRRVNIEKSKAELDLNNKLNEFPINFNTYLLNYLLSKYKKAAVENSLKKAETGKKEARLSFELGQKTKLDVLRSEANLVSLEARKTTYSDEEQTARSQFILYSGLDNSDLLFLEDLSEEKILALINELSKPGMDRSFPRFDQSPLLKSLGFEEQINSLSLSSITQSQWPDLRLQGSYNNHGDSFSTATHNPYRTHSLALILTIPFFGGGNLASSNFESYYAHKQLEAKIAQERLETQNQLNNSLTKIKAMEVLINSLAINVSQFEELYRLTSKSYQLGKSTLLELLEVQDNLLDSKISLAQNKIQFYTLSQNYLWQAGLK